MSAKALVKVKYYPDRHSEPREESIGMRES
jgi:hypothetical protein